MDKNIPAAPASDSPPAKKPAKKRASPRKNAAPRVVPVRLAEEDVARARATAGPWDRTNRYGVSEFFVHAKFGVGCVTDIPKEGVMVCLFEDGDTRKLIHAVRA